MIKTRILVLALLAVPFVAAAAQADEIDGNTFTVTIVTGPQAPQVFTGSYTFDQTLLALNGSTPLLTFDFTDPAWAGQTLSSPGFFAPFDREVAGSADGLSVFFSPGSSFFDGAFDICGFCGSGPFSEFAYGTTDINVGGSFVDEGFGTVVYGTSFVVSGGGTTPEPSSLVLLGTGLLTLGGALRRKFAALRSA
jgi:PEP-CTERM motif